MRACVKENGYISSTNFENVCLYTLLCAVKFTAISHIKAFSAFGVILRSSKHYEHSLLNVISIVLASIIKKIFVRFNHR